VVFAPNPGRIHAVLPIELPSPRTAELRDRPEFDLRVIEVSHSLREAVVE
jgi:hypothetical protein